MQAGRRGCDEELDTRAFNALISGGLELKLRNWRNLSIRLAFLPTRAFNALISGGLETLGQVNDLSDRELLTLPGFWHEGLRHVRAAIKAWADKSATLEMVD